MAALAIGTKDGAVTRLKTKVCIAAIESTGIAMLPVVAHYIAPLRLVMQRADILSRQRTAGNARNENGEKGWKVWLHLDNCIFGYKDIKKWRIIGLLQKKFYLCKQKR